MKVNLRNVCSWLVACILIGLGFVRRAKKKVMRGEQILSVYFHKPSKEEFEACVKWLKKNSFAFLSTADIENMIQQNLPFPKGSALLTVDDGWQSNEENIIEVAIKHQVPVTIFVSSAPVEEGTYWWSYILEAKKNDLKCLSVGALKKVPNIDRLIEVNKIKEQLHLKREALTVDQVKKASDSGYVTIGGHTHTHPILLNCSDEQVINELEDSKNRLESWVNKEVSYFAYPNGDYGMREINALRSLNYKLAFCSDPRPLTSNCLKDKHVLPRYGFMEGASFAENICRMVGVWQPLMTKFKSPFYKNHVSKEIKASAGSMKEIVTSFP